MLLNLLFVYTFCITSSLCFFIDYNFMHFRYNYLQLDKQTIIQEYKQMVPLCFFNLLISSFYLNYFENKYLNFTPNNYYFIVNLCLWILSTDLIFFSIHRLFHTKYLYFIHSTHHKYKYTYGMGAIYANPIEQIVANMFPPCASIIIWKIPYSHTQIITVLAFFYTIFISHGGFKIKKSHLIHHLKYKCNYGLFQADNLFGTKINKLN